MKRIMNKRMIVFITTIMVLSLSFATIGFAAGQYQNIKAWFGDIKIFKNQQQVQFEGKPFIVDGTTYVPVRAIANIFDKEVGWDQANLRIDINDKANEGQAYMLQVITAKQMEITQLTAKVAQLESELAAKKESTSISSLTDMEKALNKSYDLYKKIGFDIGLSGTTKSIKVKIYPDKADYNANWSKLSTADKKAYVEDIVDDILYEFKNADVTGYIENKSTGKTLVDFYLDSKGKLVIDTDYSGGSSSGYYSLAEMERYLDDEYYSEYDEIRPTFTLYERGDIIEVTIDVDRDDWDSMYSSDQKSFMKSVYSEISSEFRYGYIDIYVQDTYMGKDLDYYGG